jgi:hypothetical protein
VAGGRPDDAGIAGAETGDDGGRVQLVLLVAEHAVQAGEDARRSVAFDGIGAQRGAQLSHHDSRAQAVAGDVSYDGQQAAVGLYERVVPVAADVQSAGGRQVAGCQEQLRDGGQFGELGPLEGFGGVAMLLVAAGVLQSDAGTAGQFDQHDGLVGIESGTARGHDQHAQDAVPGEGNTQQRLCGGEGRGRQVIDAGQAAGVGRGVLGPAGACGDHGSGRPVSVASGGVVVEEPDIEVAGVAGDEEFGQSAQDVLVVERCGHGVAGVGEEGQQAPCVLCLDSCGPFGIEQVVLGQGGGLQFGVEGQDALVVWCSSSR